MNSILFVLFLAAAAPSTDFLTAIRNQDVANVQTMLEADPSLADGKAVTRALFILVNKETFIQPQDNQILKLVMARHPKLDLWQTAALGTPEALKKMLKQDSVNALNEFGWAPLHMAAFAGNVPNAKLLLDRGADFRLRAKTKFRNSPFLVAMLTRHPEMVALLLDRGADVLERQAEGDTALHESAAAGDFPLVKLLVERGSDLGARDDDGKSPLDYAVERKHDEVAEFLRSKAVPR